jgi:hypothetical protein
MPEGVLVNRRTPAETVARVHMARIQPRRTSVLRTLFREVLPGILLGLLIIAFFFFASTFGGKP